MAEIELTESQKLLEKLLNENGLVKPYINSYNHAFLQLFDEILGSYHIETVNGNWGKFSNIIYQRPSIPTLDVNGGNKNLYPNDARLKHISYTCKAFVTLSLYSLKGNVIETVPYSQGLIYIGNIPVPVGSILDNTVYHMNVKDIGETETDRGGYFIIEGTEYYLQTEEHLSKDVPLIYNNKGKVIVRYTSTRPGESTTINEVSEDAFKINCTFSRMMATKKTLNVFVLYYILGLKKDTVERAMDIMENLIVETDRKKEAKRRKDFRHYMQSTISCFNVKIQVSNEEREHIKSLNREPNMPDDKANGIAKDDKISRTLGEIFPDLMGNSNDNVGKVIEMIKVEFLKNIVYDRSSNDKGVSALMSKIRTLSYMILKYVDYKNGYRQLDDRDTWANKYLENAGLHLASKFSTIWRSLLVDLQTSVRDKKYEKVEDIAGSFKHAVMFDEFKKSFRKKTWSMSGGKHESVIPEIVERKNPISSIIGAVRIGVPTNRKAPLREKRFVHNSQFNIVCPFFTSDGDACGLVKDPAITLDLSLKRHQSVLDEYIILGGKFSKPENQGDKIVLVEFVKPGDYILSPLRPANPKSITTENDNIMYKYFSNYRNSLFINGIHMGYTDSKLMYEKMIELRRSGKIFRDIGIVLNQYNELWISTSGGRPMIPYLVVISHKNVYELKYKILGIDKTNYMEMMRTGCIEYISASEQEQSYILIATDESMIESHRKYLADNIIENEKLKKFRADVKSGRKPEKEYTKTDESNIEKSYNEAARSQRYTHCMIDPSQYVGISVFSMKYMSHNPAARISYQAGMTKQALSDASSMRFDMRFDAKTLSLLNTEASLGGTLADRIINKNKYFQGVNAILAVMPFQGNNQEDCIIFNRGSIDRGLFQYILTHGYSVPVKNEKGKKEEIRIPSHSESKADKYRHLDKRTGIVMEGSRVKEGDCLVGKVVVITETMNDPNNPNKKITTKKEKDESLYVKIGKAGVVDEVYESFSASQNRLILIRVVEVKVPEEGDKFTSGYAQKGTAGNLADPTEMPFVGGNPSIKSDDKGRLYISKASEKISSVDILFNPHGLPSRMTVGKIIEFLTGSIALNSGVRSNASAHMPFNYQETIEKLKMYGYNEDLTYTMYNGVTGCKLDAKIFIGPVHYQALPHLVSKKEQARGTGRKRNLTHQPTAGIRQEGGLRFGEMEKDILIAYGSSYLLVERLCISSDAFKAVTCRKCGQFAQYSEPDRNYKCLICADSLNIKISRVSYPIKLFIQTLAGAHVNIGMFAGE